jgi:phage host-nuclease inhibitor protein Gam
MSATSVALYELGQARDVLDEWLEESDGEATPELEQLMADLEIQVETKVVNVALYIREQIATSLAIDEEIERLTKRRDAHKHRADRLKRYLEAWMERLGKTKIDTDPRAKVSIQLNNPSVRGELAVDVLQFMHGAGSPIVRFKPATYELDRTAVLALHKAGGELPTGITVERSSSLRIR